MRDIIPGELMFQFNVTTESTDRLDLKGLCERHIAELWMPVHLLPQEAEEFALDNFKRAVLADLDMLYVQVERPEWLVNPEPLEDA